MQFHYSFATLLSIVALVIWITGTHLRDDTLIQNNTNEPNGDYCLTSVDCAMNGECIRPSSSSSSKDPQTPGVCQCFGGWKGKSCEELDFLPVDSKKGGLKLPNGTSTWGGSIIYVNGEYHMFASEITHHCGLYSWTTNSQVIRATSSDPFGPYVKQQVIVPVFAHDANVMLAPTGEIVLFVTARSGVVPVDCNNEMYHDPSLNKTTSTTPPKDTYMLWAPNPEGPWSEPVLVLNSSIWNEDYWEKTHRFAHCDANLNGIILSDKSFLGLWRRCETKDLHTIPHTLYASDWRNASTYQPNINPLFVLGGSGAEDPSNIWVTKTDDVGIAYHAIFHDEQATRCMLGQCSGNGRHAFSLDGKAWTYSKTDAYDRNVTFSNGKALTVDTRARPHLVVRENSLLALSTGLKPSSESGYVWTLLQPLRQQNMGPLTGSFLEH